MGEDVMEGRVPYRCFQFQVMFGSKLLIWIGLSLGCSGGGTKRILGSMELAKVKRTLLPQGIELSRPGNVVGLEVESKDCGNTVLPVPRGGV
jgi:hypothetical protein